MLRSLRILNLALVEELDWDLPPGFTAVTGETGAGKSVILGALQFLLGERAERGVVRSGATSATIEAVFEFEESTDIDLMLEENGVETCQDGQLLLKRSIAAEGSGRQFINGSPCNLSLLKELGARLVDLHGPHDHQSLFSRKEQTLLLDRYSEALPLRESYLKLRSEVTSIRRELDELNSTSGGADRITHLLEVVEEIKSASISEGEEQELIARHKAASNSRRLIELAGSAINLLDDDQQGVSVVFRDVTRQLRELSRLDDRASPHIESFEELIHNFGNLLGAIRNYADSIEIDATELQKMEDRLNLLATLRRKYGPLLTDVIAHCEETNRELDRLASMNELRGAAEQRLEKASNELTAASLKLGKKRHEGAVRLAATVAGELKDLGFRQAGFKILLEDQSEHGPDGGELAEFLFAPNPGEPSQPLRAIASSGEISRLMLALKSALAEEDKIPLLVFDEIDANVGGEIATKVAAKMRQLGNSHQVLCITHLPQVAAAASKQFLVSKEISEGRTETSLRLVDGEDRVSELARMLGGVTESAQMHAVSLLENKVQTSERPSGRSKVLKSKS